MRVKLFSFRNIEVYANIMTLPIIVICVAMGLYEMIVISFVSLTLHEYSHVCMARRLGITVEYIEIQPCGLTARINGNYISLSDELVIAAIGPVFSIVCGSITKCIIAFVGFETTLLNNFAMFNIILGMINAIPVLPLDGGRIFSSLLNQKSPLQPKQCSKICNAVGLMISASMIGFGIYSVIKGIMNFTIMIIGILVLLGVLGEMRGNSDRIAKTMLKRNAAIASGCKISINYYALSSQTKVKSAVALLNSGKMNVIEVIDNNMSIISHLDEGTLVHCAAIDKNMTLGEAAKIKEATKLLLHKEK